MAVCIIGGVGFKLFWDYRTEQNYKNTYNNYIEDLRKVQLLMLTSGSKAETLCNLTLNVWGNTIHEKEIQKRINIPDRKDILLAILMKP